MNLRQFLSELRHRRVYRVAAVYALVAWLVIQVAAATFPAFEIPTWAVRLVILLVLLGFPIALVLAWVFEITPEGLRRTSAAESPATPPRSPARVLCSRWPLS